MPPLGVAFSVCSLLSYAFTKAAAPRMAASLSGNSETRISTLPLKMKHKCSSNDLRAGSSNTSPAFTGPPNRNTASGPLKVTVDFHLARPFDLRGPRSLRARHPRQPGRTARTLLWGMNPNHIRISPSRLVRIFLFAGMGMLTEE